MTKDLQALGRTLRARREELGLSIEQLAEIVCKTLPERKYVPWVRANHIKLAEEDNCQNWPWLSGQNIEDIASALGVSVEESDRWCMLAGYVPPSLLRMVEEKPGHWAAVRRVLGAPVLAEEKTE